jgi:hypothetical protein
VSRKTAGEGREEEDLGSFGAGEAGAVRLMALVEGIDIVIVPSASL